jgi:3-oxoacyl-[acyl-carrier-protein] synthase-3
MTKSRRAVVKAIQYHLPIGRIDNENLSAELDDYSASKIFTKTGIRTRAVSGIGECSSDLAVAAGLKLLSASGVNREEIDFLLLCTQSPDYFLPSTSCLVHRALDFPESCGCFDYNLGCSGFVYGLSVAKGLIETGQARNVLLITSDTYTKFIHPKDKSVRCLFGDGAAATLIGSIDSQEDMIGNFIFGTDGTGAKNLIVPAGGMRKAFNPAATELVDSSGNVRTENNLYMNGPEIFNFTLNTVPKLVSNLLDKSGLKRQDLDLWVLHQANKFMLDHLRKKLELPEDRVPIFLESCGNTVSSSIPITLAELGNQGKLQSGQLLALIGFGVGYSWAACTVRWE